MTAPEALLLTQVRQATEAYLRSASPQQKQAFETRFEDAHAQTIRALRGQSYEPPREGWFGRLWSALKRGEQDVEAFITDDAIVTGDGQLLGSAQYELLDPRWMIALVEYLENRDNKYPFPSSPQTITLPSQASIALVGDWGTGYYRGADSPAAKVADAVNALRPDYTVHLGDVYYAGTEQQERDNFIKLWPAGKVDQFALNSNHEMYSGGAPYFTQALPQRFASQNGTSYFALQNDDWVIIGLDTAYEATDMYLDGSLGSDTSQTRWLAALAATIGKRRVALLSHHEPLSASGDDTPLLAQVTGLLGRSADYWYWGHLHNVITYRPHGSGMLGRCVGHGAIAYGAASDLAKAGAVDWYETKLAGDAESPLRVLNGFAMLQLDGPNLSEQLVGEDGSIRWQPGQTKAT